MSAKPTSPRHYLVYSIAQERLYGVVNGVAFDMKAYSGGGRGSVGDRRAEASAQSWDYRVEKVSKAVGERGGPIPPGRYAVERSESNKTLGEACKLRSLTAHLSTPTRGYGFPGGFYIHGRGDQGSDGCIVPQVPDLRRALFRELDKVAPIQLWVVLSLNPPTRQEVLKKLTTPFTA